MIPSDVFLQLCLLSLYIAFLCFRYLYLEENMDTPEGDVIILASVELVNDFGL